MKSNFELGDEQPIHPIDSPTRRQYKKSGKKDMFVYLYTMKKIIIYVLLILICWYIMYFFLVNPVTGEEMGQPGQFYTPPRVHAVPQSVGSQERLKNRIPPGGFSTPLW